MTMMNEQKIIERLELLLFEADNGDGNKFFRAFKRNYPTLSKEGKQRLIDALMQRVDIFMATGLAGPELAVA
jgi:hypothetical protein